MRNICVAGVPCVRLTLQSNVGLVTSNADSQIWENSKQIGKSNLVKDEGGHTIEEVGRSSIATAIVKESY